MSEKIKNLFEAFENKKLTVYEFTLLMIVAYYPQEVRLTASDIQSLLDIGRDKRIKLLNDLREKGYTRYIQAGRNRKGYYDFASIPFEFDRISNLLIIIQVGGQEPKEVNVNANGELTIPQEGFKKIKNYIAHLIQKHGQGAVNYTYTIQTKNP